MKLNESGVLVPRSPLIERYERGARAWGWVAFVLFWILWIVSDARSPEGTWPDLGWVALWVVLIVSFAAWLHAHDGATWERGFETGAYKGERAP